MSIIREWILRVWSIIRPRRSDDDLEQELQLHFELAQEDERRRSTSADDVTRAAVRRVGAVSQSVDRLRDQRGVPWLEDLARDARYGIRTLRRSPTFAAVTLATIAIAVGANTAVFSVLNSVLLKPLRYPDADELVAVWHTAPGAPGLATVSGDLRLSPSMYLTYADHNRTFRSIGLWFSSTVAVTGVAEPEQVRALLVTHSTLHVLGVQPLHGRWLTAADEEPGAGPIALGANVMLGHGYWQRRFGGNASVIGQTIVVDSRPRQIVGVMPAGFRVMAIDPELIVPMAFNRARQILPGFGYQAIARLKPGASLDDANADVARLIPLWMTSWPPAGGGSTRAYEAWRITPAVRPLKQDVVGPVGNILWIVMATVGIVMIIACANVANLLLVRAEQRQQELALRAALGAGWRRVARGLLVESLVLGLAGGAIGLLLAAAGLRWLVGMGPDTLPRLHEIGLDARALAFTFAVSLLSGVVFGLIPALKYARPHVMRELGSARTSTQSRERHRARNVLAVSQVALALVLLVGAGLMIRTVQYLDNVEPGFANPERLQTMRITVPTALAADPEAVARLQQAIVDKLQSIPGVVSAVFASAMHMEAAVPNWDAIQAEGIETREMPPLRLFKSVSPDFFATTGTRIVAGREYAWTDLFDRRQVVILSENLARELFDTPSAAIGRRVRTSANSAPWREVIGVVQDVRDNGVHAPAPATVYWPTFGPGLYRAGQDAGVRAVTFAIRSDRAGDASFINEVRAAVWAVNASLPVAGMRTLQEIFDETLARTSFTLVMLTLAAGAALTLGLLGIYGVISYSVSQRTREIGIRVALGAARGKLILMFLRDGVALAGIGIVMGLGAAAGLAQVMSRVVFGVSPLDPVTYSAVPLVLLLAAMLASYLPARRAAAIQPSEALKQE